MKRPILCAILAMLALAPLATADTTVVVVRHAEKALDQGKDPHLTAAGHERAELLAALLRTQKIGGLYTSEFHRTRETLVPLAEQSGLTIVTVPARETAERLTPEHLLAAHPDQVVVISSHSNLAPGIVEALTGREAPPIDDSTYDDLFLVTLHETAPAHFLRLKYGQAPDAGPRDQSRP